MRNETLSGTVVAFADTDGVLLCREEDANLLLGEMFGTGADWIAIPATRMHPDMLDLSTRQLGLFLQKFITYRIGVAIVGDLGPRLWTSQPLVDFVRESNRGRHVWFVADAAALAARFGAPE